MSSFAQFVAKVATVNQQIVWTRLADFKSQFVGISRVVRDRLEKVAILTQINSKYQDLGKDP